LAASWTASVNDSVADGGDCAATAHGAKAGTITASAHAHTFLERIIVVCLVFFLLAARRQTIETARRSPPSPVPGARRRPRRCPGGRRPLGRWLAPPAWRTSVP